MWLYPSPHRNSIRVLIPSARLVGQCTKRDSQDISPNKRVGLGESLEKIGTRLPLVAQKLQESEVRGGARLC